MKRFGRGCKPRPAKSAFGDGAKYTTSFNSLKRNGCKPAPAQYSIKNLQGFQNLEGFKTRFF